MPLSAAEKQRRYRQRRDADQARRAEYLEKEKERYRQLKETRKRKSQGSYVSTEKKWRLHKRDIRKRKKEVQNIMTPPGSPQQIEEPAPQLADVGENQRGSSRLLSASRRNNRQREKAMVYIETT